MTQRDDVAGATSPIHRFTERVNRHGLDWTRKALAAMWLLTLIGALTFCLLTWGCVLIPPPAPPGPHPGPPPAVRAVAIMVQTASGAGVAGARCTIATGQGDEATTAGNDGYALWQGIPASLRDTQIACTAEGYEPASGHRILTTSDNEQIAAALVLTPAVVRRTGLVHLDGHVYADDGGQYLGIGASLFWAGWGCVHDRARLETRNLAVLKGRVDYIRVLATVGPGGWTDRTVTAADMAQAVACITDLAYDQFGLRVDWTIFGGIDTTLTPESRADLVRRFAAVIVSRAHKVQRVQMGNESWQVGFGGDAGRAELRQLARLAHELLPNLISVTSPQYTDGRDVGDWYDGLGFVDQLVVSVHPDRNISGTGGIWRPVRQAWDVQFWTRLPWDNDEPIGPQSSVASDDDPLRLTMAAAYTWLCGGAGYTLHTGAGTRGGGIEDLNHPSGRRVANLDEVAHITETLAGMNAVRSLLPADLPNWQRHNSNNSFPGYPFESGPIGALIERGQLLRAFAVTDGGGRVIVMPIVATVPVPFTARSAMHVDVYDPLTGARLESVELAAGQTYTMSPRDAAVLVGR